MRVAQRHPDVSCVELDAPSTATPKGSGIAGAGLGRPNHFLAAADLASMPLAEALKRTPWRPDVRSTIVAERLLKYLREGEVQALLAQLRDVTQPGSQLAITAMDADARGRVKLPFTGGLLG